MESTSVSSTDGASSPVSLWNCLACKQRKVRCPRGPRLSPCANCVKAGVSCVYPTSGRIPTRRDKPKDSQKKQTELLGRLRRLENILSDLTPEHQNKTLSNSKEHADNSAFPSSLASFTRDKENVAVHGKILVDKSGSSYVGNGFWVAIADEVEELRKELEHNNIKGHHGDSSIDEDDEPGLSSAPQLKSTSHIAELAPQPLRTLWQVYVKNIDLNIKVIHTPTVEHTLSKCKYDITLLSQGYQALMTVIGLAAVVSMSDIQVLESFSQCKEALIITLRMETDKALSRADVLNTTDLTVIQAMIIYLEIVGPRNGNKATWALAGQLSRVAVSMGLHRDGAGYPDVSPFDAELRRRAWWHILFVDERVGDGQASELLISEKIFDTRPPTNVNDADLEPNMKKSPPPREGVTDSTICILRAELWRLSRALLPSLSLHKAKNSTPSKNDSATKLITATQQHIESHILRFLDANNTSHRHIAGLVRLSLIRADLLANHASALAPQSSKSFLTSWSYLEITHSLATTPGMEQWNWIFTGCIPWYALSTLLMQLRRWPWGILCERAWTAVVRVAEKLPASAWRDGPHQPVKGLLLGTRVHRERELERLKRRPDVWRRMGELGELDIDWMAGPLSRATIDLSYVEERLAAETNISSSVPVERVEALSDEAMNGNMTLCSLLADPMADLASVLGPDSTSEAAESRSTDTLLMEAAGASWSGSDATVGADGSAYDFGSMGDMPIPGLTKDTLTPDDEARMWNELQGLSDMMW